MGFMKDRLGRRIDKKIVPVPNMVGWWDASRLTGPNGDPVGVLPDISGNGADVSQVTLSKRPTVVTNGLNGLRTLRFTGAQYLYANLSPAGEWGIGTTYAQPVTHIIVAKGNTPVGASIRGLIGNIGLISEAGTGNMRAVAGTSGPYWLGGIDDNWHIWVVTLGTTGSTLARDGVVVGTSTTQTHGTGTLSNPVLGATTYLGASPWGPGEIAEAMTFASGLTPEQWLPIVEALGEKWGINIVPTVQSSRIAYQELVDAGGQTVRIFLPRDTSSPVNLLIYSHQQSGTRGVAAGYFTFPMVQTLVAEGWAVAISDNHGADSWSSTAVQTDLVNARTLVGTLCTVGKTVLYGISMGGSVSCIAAANGLIPNLAGVVLEDAAVNLRWMYNHAYAGSMATGFGLVAGTLAASSSIGATSLSSSVSFPAGTVIAVDPSDANSELLTVAPAGPTGSGPYSIPLVSAATKAHASGVVISDYGTKTAGKDPMLRPMTDYGNIPFALYASSADTAVDLAANSQAFATALVAASGRTAETRTVFISSGGHLSPYSHNPGDILAFVRRCVA